MTEISLSGLVVNAHYAFFSSLHAYPFFSSRNHVVVVPGFYDEARTNSTVAPEEVVDEVELKKQPTKLVVDRETVIGN